MFQTVFRPSSGTQNCTYSIRYRSDKYLTLYVQFWALDDGWKNHLKHVESLTEINKLWNRASCRLYSANKCCHIFSMTSKSLSWVNKLKKKKTWIAMNCTAKEVSFDDWKKVDATELLESHKLELYMYSCWATWRVWPCSKEMPTTVMTSMFLYEIW